MYFTPRLHNCTRSLSYSSPIPVISYSCVDGGSEVERPLHTLFSAYCSLLSPQSSALSPHYLLLTTHHSLLTTHYSLHTTHYSLLTTHYSLLTTHSHYLLRSTQYSVLSTASCSHKRHLCRRGVKPVNTSLTPSSLSDDARGGGDGHIA